MPCYHPLLAYKLDGKVTFNKPFAYAKGFNLPCGQCIGCRLSYSRQWAIRCVHEAQMHEESCFITLTFSPEEMAKRDNPASLDVTEFQRFMKRLRKKYGKVRFFHCGEYGEKNKRPHYHALLFGLDFKDKELFSKRDDVRLYTSQSLAELWPHGFSTIGEVNFESAAYVARYVMKKVRGEGAEEYYSNWIDPITGEVTDVKPEYATMSRKPGIGYEWFKEYKDDVFPHDYCVVRGHEVRPPRYYETLLSEEELAAVKEKRKEKMPEVYDQYDERMDRLWVSQEVKLEALKRLVRDL
jgi:hypothetical protein